MVSSKIITILAFITANAICSEAFQHYFSNQKPYSGYQYMNNWSSNYPGFYQSHWNKYPSNHNQGYRNFFNPGFSNFNRGHFGSNPWPSDRKVYTDGPKTTVKEYDVPTASSFDKKYFGGLLNLHFDHTGRKTGKETTTRQIWRW
ncbi:uncharacterized protein LOC123268153 isoform X3 [Cotesia glomerata]|uniref:Uncharacterized protein n=1 Tax=Cotesia glomerata TaxID=32391 RepID=A0AAV7HSA1_COTGL|nr:uncharacterized protein LOC123268153 isoform X3 [Cotesia glomerata]KAH0534536.1 hypothetical protein KQX54_004952 [Cotesia glomerata]